MAAKLTKMFNKFTEMVGLNNGYVEDDNEDVIVERNIESAPTEKKETPAFEKKEQTRYSFSSRIEEEDFDVASDSERNLFSSKTREEDKKEEAEKKAREMNAESIARSERRLQYAKAKEEAKQKEETRQSENKEQTKRGESAMAGISESQKINLCVARPTEFSIEGCREICSNLRAQRMVTINFEDVKSNDDKCRIYDFVCGCCVALDCKLEKVSREVYIATPYNARVYKMGEKEEAQTTQETFSFN